MAGQLRAALAGQPGGMPVPVSPAGEPRGGVTGDDQVVISAAPWARVHNAAAQDVRRKLASGELARLAFAAGLACRQ